MNPTSTSQVAQGASTFMAQVGQFADTYTVPVFNRVWQTTDHVISSVGLMERVNSLYQIVLPLMENTWIQGGTAVLGGLSLVQGSKCAWDGSQTGLKGMLWRAAWSTGYTAIGTTAIALSLGTQIASIALVTSLAVNSLGLLQAGRPQPKVRTV